MTTVIIVQKGGIFPLVLDSPPMIKRPSFNCRFLIIPTEKEVSTQKYSQQTKKYIDLLRMDKEVEIIEPIKYLKTIDYIKPNGYLSESGSRVIGKLICKNLNIL